MHKFDTKVQHLKYKVLREVARLAWNDQLLDNILDIPETIVPGKKATMRCCVYKERAILGERVKLALGGDKSNPNVIEVIEIACDECPVGGFEVTNACRGCLMHRCEDVCKFGAISFDGYHVAHIDKSKCRECGACAKVCPYMAIVSRKRPCQNACKVKAISMNDDLEATIDANKCIQCGACVYQCPFGAISDKSYIVDAISMLKDAQNTNGKVYAIVAPAIASQFAHAKLGQVVSGLKALGFSDVVETALGADMVALAESQELAQKGVLTSSCCPAFVTYIRKYFPQLKDHISHNYSPMVEMGRHIKEKDPKYVYCPALAPNEIPGGINVYGAIAPNTAYDINVKHLAYENPANTYKTVIYLSTKKITRPAQFPYLLDSIYLGKNGTKFTNRFLAAFCTTDVNWGQAAMRHKRVCNILAVDGHVVSIKPNREFRTFYAGMELDGSASKTASLYDMNGVRIPIMN